ncbi:cytochrome b [Colwelliaceae bacterium BS250]
MITNTANKYGLITKIFHWFSGLAIIATFALGFWMVDLTYYSSWYKTAPHWHKSIGILLLMLTIVRLVLKYKQVKVQPISEHSAFIKKSSSATHKLLYLLMFIAFFSGYLISTADSRSIEVFNLFSVPGAGELFSNQEDIAGLIHEYVAYSLISLALIHALGALKHHFIDKDDTLKRMLK